jgi:hypothetical protein
MPYAMPELLIQLIMWGKIAYSSGLIGAVFEDAFRFELLTGQRTRQRSCRQHGTRKENASSLPAFQPSQPSLIEFEPNPPSVVEAFLNSR